MDLKIIWMIKFFKNWNWNFFYYIELEILCSFIELNTLAQPRAGNPLGLLKK